MLCSAHGAPGPPETGFLDVGNPVENPCAVASLYKRKCPPEGEHFVTLLFTGRCTWENQIRRFRNRQNL
jgi:hypothetical protein